MLTGSLTIGSKLDGFSLLKKGLLQSVSQWFAGLNLHLLAVCGSAFLVNVPIDRGGAIYSLKGHIGF